MKPHAKRKVSKVTFKSHRQRKLQSKHQLDKQTTGALPERPVK